MSPPACIAPYLTPFSTTPTPAPCPQSPQIIAPNAGVPTNHQTFYHSRTTPCRKQKHAPMHGKCPSTHSPCQYETADSRWQDTSGVAAYSAAVCRLQSAVYPLPPQLHTYGRFRQFTSSPFGRSGTIATLAFDCRMSSCPCSMMAAST